MFVGLVKSKFTLWLGLGIENIINKVMRLNGFSHIL
jgi:hypothetical protein